MATPRPRVDQLAYPDSPLPLLTWTSVTVVTATKRRGAADPVYITLGDNKQRSFSGSITFNPSSVGEGGLDAGAEAASTWYYLYLVPKATDDTLLVLRGSTSDPGTGPSGYSYWKYVGAVYNDSSSDLRKFHHTGIEFRYDYITDVAAGWPAIGTGYKAKGDFSLTDGVPKTATFAHLFMQIARDSNTGNTVTAKVYIDGATYKFTQLQVANGAYDGAMITFSIPMSSSQKVQYESYRDGGSVNLSFQTIVVEGWTDGYLF